MQGNKEIRQTFKNIFLTLYAGRKKIKWIKKKIAYEKRQIEE